MYPAGALGLTFDGDWSAAPPGYSSPAMQYSITGQYAFQPAAGLQISAGQILDDFGDWIRTTAGEVLKVVVDQFGRRIVEKTGEVLSSTPLGPATAYSWARENITGGANYLPYILGGVLLVLLLRR
jgi:hypothetical protein